MIVNAKMHKDTQYQLPMLREKISKEIDHVGSFIIDCNEKNWNSYNADPVSIETIKFAAKVLEEIGKWFETNIGFLNNRTVRFKTDPMPGGDIHIDVVYDNLFCGWFFVEEGKPIDCNFRPEPRRMLSGHKTIADRDFLMVFSTDKINTKCSLEEIHVFLDEAFYEHKWKFIPDYSHFNPKYITNKDKEIFN